MTKLSLSHSEYEDLVSQVTVLTPYLLEDKGERQLEFVPYFSSCSPQGKRGRQVKVSIAAFSYLSLLAFVLVGRGARRIARVPYEVVFSF